MTLGVYHHVGFVLQGVTLYVSGGNANYATYNSVVMVTNLVNDLPPSDELLWICTYFPRLGKCCVP